MRETCVLFAGAIVLCASPLFGAFTVVDQSRSISVAGQSLGSSSGSAFNQSVDAAPDSPFDESLQNTAGDATSNASAAAEQNSAFNVSATELKFSASGSVLGSSNNGLAYFTSGSRFSLTFSVDASATYFLSEHVSSTNEEDLGMLGADLIAEGQSLLGIAITGLPRLDAGNTPNFQAGGVLAPGTYTLSGGAAGNGNLTAIDGAFDLSFNVSSAAVPLPAGVWMGAIGMVLGSVAIARCRRGYSAA